jgi:hypothetical protein
MVFALASLVPTFGIYKFFPQLKLLARFLASLKHLLRHTLLLLLKTSHHGLLRASQGHVDKSVDNSGLPVDNLWITFVSSETYPQDIHRILTAVDNLWITCG